MDRTIKVQGMLMLKLKELAIAHSIALQCDKILDPKDAEFVGDISEFFDKPSDYEWKLKDILFKYRGCDAGNIVDEMLKVIEKL
jgi:hypothetical protein